MIRLRFLRRRRGAAAAEYALVVVLIAVAVIAGASAAGGSINSLLTLTGDRLVEVGGVADCPNVGAPCADGSIYAGNTPDGGGKIYVTTKAYETNQTWNNGSKNWLNVFLRLLLP
jgi:Flp pilus assembly pilin Flp